MSYLKTYGYVGKIECSALFRLGNTNFRFDFIGGSVSADGIQPAKFSTRNIAYQTVIENSKEFLSGKIKLLQQIEVEESPEITIETEEKPAAKKTYTQVTNAQMAREVLKAEYGATQGELQNVASIRAFAEKVGVDFPSWM